MTWSRQAGAIALLLTCQTLPSPINAAPAQPARGQDLRYVIRRGDTLFHLSRAYFTGRRALDRVRQLNRVPASALILAGGTLRLPRNLLRDELTAARIDSFSGEVALQPSGGGVAVPKSGLDLTEGSVITTGKRGFLSLRLPDDTTVTIPSQSSVRIVRLRRVLINGAVEREFGSLGGRLRAKVTPMTDPASSFRVNTPITVSAVRGTEFRVSYDAGTERALTEVEDGKVQFQLGQAAAAARAPEQALLVPGFRAVAARSGMGAATALLPAPRLSDPDRAQTGPDLRFTVEPDPSAAGYRLQIARDAGLLDIVDEASGPDARFVLDAIPTGTYFVRIAALDAQGAEGRGRTYAFDRVLNAVAGTASAEGRRYRFKWTSQADRPPQFRFRLVRKDRPDVPVVDAALGSATEISVTNLRAGEYAWQVLSLVPFGDKMIATWSAEQSFEVTAKQ